MIYMLIIRKVFDIRWICFNVYKILKKRKNIYVGKFLMKKNGYFIVEKKEIKGI